MWRNLLSTLLNNPELAGGHVQSWRIGWAGGWTGLGFVAAVLIAVGVSVWLYRRQGRLLSRRLQVVLAALRAAAFTALILLLCQPVLHITKTGVVKGTCAILVDHSKSMSITDRLSHEEMVTALKALGRLPADAPADAPLSADQRRDLARLTRFDLVKQSVDRRAEAFLNPLAERFKVDLLTFGEGLRSPGGATAPSAGRPDDLEPGALPRRLLAALPPPTDEVSRIGAALRAALERLRGQPIAGIVVFTDGANNAGEDPRVVATYAGRLGVPVFPVGVGAARARDLHLAHILGDDVVFKDDVKPLTVRIRSTGYAGRTVTLVLSTGEGDDEKILKVKPDVVIAGDGEQTEEIAFLPKANGRTRINVRIEGLPDEQNLANNAQSKIVTVTDKKIRVLYVEGRPRWEYRALMHAMRRDRRVEPTFLLQEADPPLADDDQTDTRPEFIYAFPDRREDLFTYDVIIFGNVNTETLTRAQMSNVASFVEMGGGGFLLIAGEDLPDGKVGPRALGRTAVAPLLPVSFLQVRAGAAGRLGLFSREIDRPLTEGYRPRLTALGRTHPVTRLGATVAESERLWGELPEFYWFYPGIDRTRPAAQVLLEHPTARNRRGTVPLLVVQPFGQGRSMMVAFDEVWRWRAERGDAYFYRFYGQAIQFLGLSHLLGESRRVQITLDRREVGVGEPIAIFARILDESFKPAMVERITAVVRRSPGGSAAGPEAREVGRISLVAAEGAPGTYRGLFVPTEEGEYRIVVDDPALSTAGESGGLASFRARSPRLEFSNPSRDADLLQALAEQSGGAVLTLDALDRLPRLIEQRQRVEPVRFDLPLWDSWLALVLAAALPCVEWFVRKRKRLA